MKKVLFTLFFIICGNVSADVGKDAYQLVKAGKTEKAITLLTLEEHKNKPKALFMMGMIYDAGKGVKKDLAKAARYYQLAAEKGHVLAQLYIGTFYHHGMGVKKDVNKAVFWLRKASEQKNTRAMGLLAAILASPEKGEIIEAYAWAHIAAKYDPIQAQTSARKVIAHYATAKQTLAAKALMKKIESKW